MKSYPSFRSKGSLSSADACKGSQTGTYSREMPFTSTQSHNDSTHFEIRPPPTHTHMHTQAHTHNPRNVAILSCTLVTGVWPKESYLNQTESIKSYSGIWNSGNRNMAMGDIQLKCVSCKSSGRFTDSSVQTCLCLRNVRPSLLLFVDIHCPTVTGWIVSPYSDLLET